MINKEKIMKLKKENKELSERIDNLNEFMGSDEYTNLSDCEKAMLYAQYCAMHRYSIALLERISYYEEKPLIFEWRL